MILYDMILTLSFTRKAYPKLNKLIGSLIVYVIESQKHTRAKDALSPCV